VCSRGILQKRAFRSIIALFLDLCGLWKETVSKNEGRGSAFRQNTTKDRPKPFKHAKNTSKSKYFCEIDVFCPQTACFTRKTGKTTANGMFCEKTVSKCRDRHVLRENRIEMP